MSSPATRAAQTADAVPFVPWAELLPDFMATWPENARGHAEHLSLVGPTKQGKSTLALALLQERVRIRGSSVVVLGTKPKDPTLTATGWPIIRQWPPSYGQEQVIYWPKFGDVRSAAQRQRAAFEPVLAQIFADGRRTVYIDEAYYFTQLRLDGLLTQFWQQGRSVDLLVVAGTQRPSRVPRAMWSEASWLIAFRTADEDELRRVGEIGGTDSRVIRDTIRGLKPHEFLLVQTRTGAMVRSMLTRR